MIDLRGVEGREEAKHGRGALCSVKRQEQVSLLLIMNVKSPTVENKYPFAARKISQLLFCDSKTLEFPTITVFAQQN